jgi:hypothetical protein
MRTTSSSSFLFSLFGIQSLQREYHLSSDFDWIIENLCTPLSSIPGRFVPSYKEFLPGDALLPLHSPQPLLVAQKFLPGYYEHLSEVPKNAILLSTPTASGIASTSWLLLDFKTARLDPSTIELIKDRYVVLKTYLEIKNRYEGNLQKMLADWMTSDKYNIENSVDHAVNRSRLAFRLPYTDDQIGGFVLDCQNSSDIHHQIDLAKDFNLKGKWIQQYYALQGKWLNLPLEDLKDYEHEPQGSERVPLLRGLAAGKAYILVYKALEQAGQLHWRFQLEKQLPLVVLLTLMGKSPMERSEFVHWCLVDPQFLRDCDDDDYEWPGFVYFEKKASQIREAKESKTQIQEVLKEILAGETQSRFNFPKPFYFHESILEWPTTLN